MSARIVLLGATGYTGARTAEALVARGARPVLAGRDLARLQELAERLGALETVRADVAAPSSVRGLLERGDVLVTTVGPFLRLGRPAVDAAVDAGAVYLDSTGEPPFIRRVFTDDGPRAAATGAALLPALGYDYVPGQLAGALALGEAGARAHRLAVGYALDRGSGQAFSRGTLDSALGVFLERGFAFTGGQLHEEPPGRQTWRFDAGGRTRWGLSIGGSEHLTLPGLAPSLREVAVFLDWLGPLTPLVSRLSVVTGAAARLPGVARAALKVAGVAAHRASRAPAETALAGARAHVVAEVRDPGGELVSRVELSGPEPYAFTAGLLAWAAIRAAAHGVDGVGALGPVQAFGLDALTAGAADAGLVRT